MRGSLTKTRHTMMREESGPDSEKPYLSTLVGSKASSFLLPRSSHHWETGHGRETVRPGKGDGLSQSRRHTWVVNNSTCVSWFLGPEEKLCPQSLTFWGSKVTSESPRFWTSGLCGGWIVLWLHVLAERKHCQESSPTTTQGPDPDLGVTPAQVGTLSSHTASHLCDRSASAPLPTAGCLTTSKAVHFSQSL